MKSDNGYDLGSWKCGKDRAFTHIPSNFIVLFERNSSKNQTKKEGRTSLFLKKSNINSFGNFPKKLMILP